MYIYIYLCTCIYPSKTSRSFPHGLSELQSSCGLLRPPSSFRVPLTFENAAQASSEPLCARKNSSQLPWSHWGSEKVQNQPRPAVFGATGSRKRFGNSCPRGHATLARKRFENMCPSTFKFAHKTHDVSTTKAAIFCFGARRSRDPPDASRRPKTSLRRT